MINTVCICITSFALVTLEKLVDLISMTSFLKQDSGRGIQGCEKHDHFLFWGQKSLIGLRSASQGLLLYKCSAQNHPMSYLDHIKKIISLPLLHTSVCIPEYCHLWHEAYMHRVKLYIPLLHFEVLTFSELVNLFDCLKETN